MPTKFPNRKTTATTAPRGMAAIARRDTLTAADVQMAISFCVAQYREAVAAGNVQAAASKQNEIRLIVESRPRLVAAMIIETGYSFDL